MTDTVFGKIDYQSDLLQVSGELNFATVAQLWKESLPKLANYSALNFDFAKVTASNSAGLALLLAWLKYAKQHNQPIEFRHIPEQLLSIINVAGIQKLLDLK